MAEGGNGARQLARRPRDSSADRAGSGIGEARAYVAAGAVYVAIGVLVPQFLFSWAVAAAYLLLVMWGLPTLVRKALR